MDNGSLLMTVLLSFLVIPSWAGCRKVFLWKLFEFLVIGQLSSGLQFPDTVDLVFVDAIADADEHCLSH